MYREYVTVGHCEYFIHTAGIDTSNVYHSVLPEKKMRRSRLLEEHRNDCVQPQWGIEKVIPNDCEIGIFADDIVLWSSGSDIEK
ncbi:hypothetical protein TNCV_206381 [Trichonephila clavipes]|nr:hypothetical protein TNCV_206381 [Trichonephila clavipes]